MKRCSKTNLSGDFDDGNDRGKSERRPFSHSPYSALCLESNSPSNRGQTHLSGAYDEDTGLLPPETFSDPVFSKHTDPYNVASPFLNYERSRSMNEQNSFPSSLLGQGLLSGIVEGGSSLPINFTASCGASALSPSNHSASSFVHQHLALNGFVTPTRGNGTPFMNESPPIGAFNPTSYASASFSPPNPSGSFPTQYSNGIYREPFSFSPNIMNRGLVEQFLSSPKSHERSSKSRRARSDTSSTEKSNASSIPDGLPTCPNDEDCPLINDKKHQRSYIHTCRLFPCYHGHIHRHAKLFLHAEGQVVSPEGGPQKLSSQALKSVTFVRISPDAPNAYRIYVEHQKKKYEVFGDWENVKVHTFKRYLHQVCGIPPASQSLYDTIRAQVMDDDIKSVKKYGIVAESLIVLKSKEEEGTELRDGLLDNL